MRAQFYRDKNSKIIKPYFRILLCAVCRKALSVPLILTGRNATFNHTVQSKMRKRYCRQTIKRLRKKTGPIVKGLNTLLPKLGPKPLLANATTGNSFQDS